MAFGDAGGACTMLVLTMKSIGPIRKGDPVYLHGLDHGVCRLKPHPKSTIFGQAMADDNGDGTVIPVRVHGVSNFYFDKEYLNKVLPVGLPISDTLSIRGESNKKGCSLVFCNKTCIDAFGIVLYVNREDGRVEVLH